MDFSISIYLSLIFGLSLFCVAYQLSRASPPHVLVLDMAFLLPVLHKWS